MPLTLLFKLMVFSLLNYITLWNELPFKPADKTDFPENSYLRFVSQGKKSVVALSNNHSLNKESVDSNNKVLLYECGEYNHFHEKTDIAHAFSNIGGTCVAGTVNRFTGSYHSNLYIGNQSGVNVVLAWGQNMATYIGTGSGNITSPTTVSTGSYSGVPLEVRSSSSGSSTGYSALVLRTSTNLYFFGTAANLTAITTMTGFGGASLTTAASDVTSKLPSGVTISDIVQVEVSQTAFAIVTTTGDVYILTSLVNLQGDITAANSAIWHHVKLSGGSTYLTGVKKLSLSSSGAFALTNSGKIYYWGSPANVAGVANTSTSYNYAYDLSAQIPSGQTVKDLVVLGTKTPSSSTLFIACGNGKVYATGLNTNGVLGINNSTYTTNQATFQPVKTTDGTTDLTGVIKIDGDTEADIFCMAALTTTGQIFGWGDSPAGMLGVNAGISSYPVPKTVQLFYPTPGASYTDFSVAGHFTIAFYTNGTTDQYWYLGHNTGGSIGDPANSTTYILAASPASLNASGGVSFDCSNATLPLTLLTFNGKIVNNSSVLTWSTSLEMNSNRFEIEHSTDGRQFKTIGEVDAQGNSSTIIQYSFTDPNTTSNTNFYRLKMIDNDGKYEYSSVLILNHQQEFKIKLYPNPFSSNTQVLINTDKKTECYIRVLNQSGVILYNNLRLLNPGTNSISIKELSNLPEGAYIFEVRLGETKYVQQLVKVK